MKIEEITKFSEILNGVKTLHPIIYGSLLYDRLNQNHIEQVTSHQIPNINLIAVNLYPFEKVCQKTDLYNEIIENIDKGHTLIRASIKNNSQINILTNPNQYDKFISLMPWNSQETLNTEQMKTYYNLNRSY